MGIGGGFMMAVFDAESGKTFSLDAREAATRAATPDMYSGDKDSARYGPLSVAVPGEIAGYWAAKQRFGNKSIRLFIFYKRYAIYYSKYMYSVGCG